ncbi:MAG: ribosomal protein L16 Arg81 hydroxylase, partial [Maricaulis maris]
MTAPLWLTDPFRAMIDPIDRETFFRDYHEKKPLIVHREDPGRYAGLLSIARIDDIVSSIDLREGALDMARSEPPVQREDYMFDTGYVDRGGVANQYRQGATVILPQLHMMDAVLGEFCRAVESLLSCHVQTNIYLTPPDNQGFNTHYDDHDVFVMQIEGEKLWRFYETPVENPYRGEGFRPDAHKAGEPVAEFVLKAGECIYVPRGLMHDAQTHGDTASLHITLGLIVKTWADLMLEAVSEVALRTPAMRHSL